MAAERECYTDWVRAIADLPSNPLGAAVQQFGDATALLYRRIHDAHEAGCDLLVSQCAPGTTSERNQLRAGFRIAGSKVWWTPRSSGG